MPQDLKKCYGASYVVTDKKSSFTGKQVMCDNDVRIERGYKTSPIQSSI